MRADRLKGEVEHFKVQVKIDRKDSAIGVVALSELEKTSWKDQGAGSLLQVGAMNAERLLDPTGQGFPARQDAVLSDINGNLVTEIT